MLALVEISTNTGKVLRVLGVNFPSESAVVDYAKGYLQLEAPDLDAPLWWKLSDSRALTTQVQE